MPNDQLYYPNLEPKLNAKLAISFLHWDRVLRIFPRKGTANFRQSNGIINDLEKEKILVSRPLENYEIDQASQWLDRMISIVEGPLSEEKVALETLIRPKPKVFGKSDYFIYKGKTDYSFSKAYPKYFKESRDRSKNVIYHCSFETGLTYMTLLAYFMCEEMNCKNTITDSGNSFPLFIALNKYFDFSGIDKATSFVPLAKASKEVERIFYLPLLKLLEPINFKPNTTIEKIIAFRQDHDNLRKEYLEIIDAFLNDLYSCTGDDDAKDIIQQHEQKFQSHLKIMISACKEQGIPVNERIVTYGRMSNWELAGKLWDNSCKVVNIIKLNALSLIKPTLKMKPSLDFYNNVMKKSAHFYPLLIQESFAPTYAQQAYSAINKMDKIRL
jgi:hypothetical protein